MIIDAHQHFWRYNAQRDAWITQEMSRLRRDFMPEELISQLHANQVDGSIAVQADQSEEETLFLLELAGRYAEIQGVVGWVDLRSAAIRQRLEYFSSFRKLVGFRHIVQAEPDDRFMLRKDFCSGLACLQEFHFTYDILIYAKQLETAVELVRMFPEQPFVLDHLAKPPVKSGELDRWAERMHELAAAKNVWCKLSGLMTEAEWGRWSSEQFQPYFEVALQSFGPDRLMFGSDWPVCLLSGTYSQAKHLVSEAIHPLTVEQQAKIFCLNAMRFYGLDSSDTHGPATQR